MIICSKCGKENQDRYKFCLGCGSQLTAAAPSAPGSLGGSDVSRPGAGSGLSPAVSPLSSGSAQLPVTQPDSLPGLQPGAGASAGLCPDCGTPNPTEFVFCGSCGARLKDFGQRSSGAAARPVVSPGAKVSTAATLSLIRPDGTEGGTHPLTSPETVIGRGAGPLFDGDSYLSPRHARFSFSDGNMQIEDSGSLNGVFVRITQQEPLNDGDIFRIGQELLRFDIIRDPEPLEDGTDVMGSPNPGYWGRLSIIVGPGVEGSAFPLMGEEIVLGRERGDILFSDDGYVSGTHAKIEVQQDGCYLTDLGSSNGTFIQLVRPRPLPSGTFVLMGQQLFRADLL